MAAPELHALPSSGGRTLVQLTAPTEPAGAEQLADLVAKRLATANVPPSSPVALLTVRQVLAARPGLTRSWLYENAAACGAIRKNRTKRSPLWFRLQDVDAELARRTKAAMDGADMLRQADVRPPFAIDAPRGCTRTAKGSPRAFPVRPRLDR